jgi:cytochrome P450
MVRLHYPPHAKYPFEIGPFGSTTLAYDTYRADAPVCRVLMPSGLEAWLVTRYSDVCTVFRDPRFSRQEAVRVGAAQVKGSGLELNPDLMQNTDGKRHLRLRTAFSSYYSAGHRLLWTEIIETEARKTLEVLATAASAFDLRSAFFEPVARRSAERLFGFPFSKRRPGIIKVSFDERGMLDLQDHAASILLNRRTVLASPYLQGITASSRDGLLSHSELLANLTFFISLTFEAVAAPFLGGIFAMLRDLDQWQTCQKDRSLLSNAINEMLRSYPNGDGQFLRIAMEDAVLSGVTIKRGDAVLAPAPAANVDPYVFSNPRRFDVHRRNSNKHVAFGVGPHHCLGSLLVEVWMRTALLALLDRFPSLRLAVPPTAITYKPISFINIIERLPATCLAW